MRLRQSDVPAILLLYVVVNGAARPVRGLRATASQGQSSLSIRDDGQPSDNGPRLCRASVGESRQFTRSQPAFSAGLRNLQEKRYEKAIPLFLAALKQDPSFVTARYDLGVAYFAINRFEDARTAFRSVLQQSPGHRLAQYFLARIDLVQGNDDAAIRGFRKMSEPKPLADELYYLGEAYFRKGDNREAIRTLRRASARQPGDYRVHLLLGLAYRKVGLLSQGREEIVLSENLRALYRQKSQEILECGSALDSSSPGRAVNLCRQLLDGSDPAKLVSLGVLFAQKQLYQQALSPLEKAARTDFSAQSPGRLRA